MILCVHTDTQTDTMLSLLSTSIYWGLCCASLLAGELNFHSMPTRYEVLPLPSWGRWFTQAWSILWPQVWMGYGWASHRAVPEPSYAFMTPNLSAYLMTVSITLPLHFKLKLVTYLLFRKDIISIFRMDTFIHIGMAVTKRVIKLQRCVKFLGQETLFEGVEKREPSYTVGGNAN